MKPNISLVCKKSTCFPPVKMVLGQLPPGKMAPNPNLNANANPNSNPNRGGQFSSRAIVRTPVKTKETKNGKEIKKNRRNKKQIKQKTLSFIKLTQIFPNN